MESDEYRRRVRAGVLWAHNEFVANRPDTPERAEVCRIERIRARDMTLHGEPVAIVEAELVISKAEYERLRREAVEVMRWGCRVCGQCARFGLSPP